MVYDKNNRNLNLEMVEVGLAWVYRKYYMHPLWISLEKKPRKKRLGYGDEKPCNHLGNTDLKKETQLNHK